MMFNFRYGCYLVTVAALADLFVSQELLHSLRPGASAIDVGHDVLAFALSILLVEHLGRLFNIAFSFVLLLLSTPLSYLLDKSWWPENGSGYASVSSMLRYALTTKNAVAWAHCKEQRRVVRTREDEKQAGHAAVVAVLVNLLLTRILPFTSIEFGHALRWFVASFAGLCAYQWLRNLMSGGALAHELYVRVDGYRGGLEFNPEHWDGVPQERRVEYDHERAIDRSRRTSSPIPSPFAVQS